MEHPQIGKVPDTKLANYCGVSDHTARRAREALGLPIYKPRPPLGKRRDSLIADPDLFNDEVPDLELAMRHKMSDFSVKKTRREYEHLVITRLLSRWKR